jgi:type IV secretory pathway VirB10-like protein
MSSQTSRKIIVAGVMAAVVGIGVVTFALRSHRVISVAQAAHPPTPVTQIPAAALREAEIPPAPPPPVAQTPDVPAAVTQPPDAPAAVAHHDSAGTSSTDTATPAAVERKVPRKQHLAKADTSAVATDGTVARTGSAANTTETVTNSVDHAKSADELTTTPAINSPAEDQKAGTSTEFVDSDSPVTPK